MSVVEDMKRTAEASISFHEARLESIGSVFDSAHDLLEGWRDSFVDARREREQTSAQLREILAKNGSLRRKDFDNMMRRVLLIQDERETQVRGSLDACLDEHKAMAKGLRENLGKFRESLSRGDVERLKEFRQTINTIVAEQDNRRKEVTAGLKEFQKEQQEISRRLKDLLAKGRELRTGDVKAMLKDFNARHKAWMNGWKGGREQEQVTRKAEKQERRENVRGMIAGFKNRRANMERKWEKGMVNAFAAINIDVKK